MKVMKFASLMVAIGVLYGVTSVLAVESTSDKVEEKGYGQTSPIPQNFDYTHAWPVRMHMKNGDLISGLVVNETLNIKTPYTSFQLLPDELSGIEIQGGTTLSNLDFVSPLGGDKMSGTLETLKIQIMLTANSYTEIGKDQIVRIDFLGKDHIKRIGSLDKESLGKESLPILSLPPFLTQLIWEHKRNSIPRG